MVIMVWGVGPAPRGRETSATATPGLGLTCKNPEVLLS